jgi:hypothetical protein
MVAGDIVNEIRDSISQLSFGVKQIETLNKEIGTSKDGPQLRERL